jgi:hydrogenase maturation protease
MDTDRNPDTEDLDHAAKYSGRSRLQAGSPVIDSRLQANSLVIGLGNPILGDDGFGWRVAEEVRKAVEGVEVDCLAVGGLALMERMVGYDRVILVDAMYSGQKPPGSLACFPLSKLPDASAGHSGSAHDVSLAQALELGRRMGADLPEEVTVVAVEAENVYDFSETLSPAIQAAVPEAVDVIIKQLYAVSG